jgi:hypothetical protein
VKLCVLTPSANHLASAGVRVRYRRIESPLSELGHELSVLPITQFKRPQDFKHDVYIVSKYYDASALVAARLITARGRALGVDLFDDYYSQLSDSRFAWRREWLTALLGSADFILCSTPAMQAIAQRIAPNHPAHILNDPYGQLDRSAVAAALARKLERLHQTRTLRLGWFGVGDNPYFSVGLADLAAFGGELARLRTSRFDVRLEILTNRQAVTADALAALHRLALPFEIDEWSEPREATLLDRCTACFLPVNAQSFSVVKSLNRAVTALTAGTQVLSAGYPLYESLGEFIYRDAGQLLADLEDRRPLLRPETLESFDQLMESYASPTAEAYKLSAFLQKFSPRPTTQMPHLAVVHGPYSTRGAHLFVQSMGGLSVASPFARQQLPYDLRFILRPNGPGVDLLIASDKRRKVAPKFAAHLVPDSTFLDAPYHRLDLAHLGGDANWDTTLGRLRNPAAMSAVLGDGMAFVERALALLFPGITCVRSLARRPAGEKDAA